MSHGPLGRGGASAAGVAIVNNAPISAAMSATWILFFILIPRTSPGGLSYHQNGSVQPVARPHVHLRARQPDLDRDAVVALIGRPRRVAQHIRAPHLDPDHPDAILQFALVAEVEL